MNKTQKKLRKIVIFSTGFFFGVMFVFMWNEVIYETHINDIFYHYYVNPQHKQMKRQTVLLMTQDKGIIFQFIQMERRVSLYTSQPLKNVYVSFARSSFNYFTDIMSSTFRLHLPHSVSFWLLLLQYYYLFINYFH